MTVQTFLKAAQSVGLAHNSGAGGEFILVGTGKQLEKLGQTLQGDGGYVPGVMRCDRCKFEVTRMSLNVNVGTVTAGDSEPEPCPNGCGPLRPTTWKEHANAAFEGVDALLERAEKAEKELAALGVAPSQPEQPAWLRCEFCHQLGCRNPLMPAGVPATPPDNRTRPLTDSSQRWTPEHCKTYPRRASEEIEYLRGQLAAHGVEGKTE